MTTEPKNELPETIYAEIKGTNRIWRPSYEQADVPHGGMGEYRLVSIGNTPVHPAKAGQGESYDAKILVLHALSSVQFEKGQTFKQVFPDYFAFIESALTAESEGTAGKGDTISLAKSISDQCMPIPQSWKDEQSSLNEAARIMKATLTRPQEIDVERIKSEVYASKPDLVSMTWDEIVDHIVDRIYASGYLSAPDGREKELMAVIRDFHIDALRHKTHEQTWHTIAKHAAIIAQAQKGE